MLSKVINSLSNPIRKQLLLLCGNRAYTNQSWQTNEEHSWPLCYAAKFLTREYPTTFPRRYTRSTWSGSQFCKYSPPVPRTLRSSKLDMSTRPPPVKFTATKREFNQFISNCSCNIIISRPKHGHIENKCQTATKNGVGPTIKAEYK